MRAEPWRALGVLLQRELRDLARDRRTVWLSIVAPLVIAPLVLFGNAWLQRQREDAIASAVLTYAVRGPAADQARSLLTRALADDPTAPPLPASESASGDPEQALQDRQLTVLIDAARPAHDDRLHLTLWHRADRDVARELTRRLQDRLQRVQRAEREGVLVDLGLAEQPADVGRIQAVDLASSAESAGAWIGRFVVALVLFLMLSGGAVVAADSVAGEKERGTLETLLSSAVDRRLVLLAKGLAIAVVGAGIALLQVLDLAVCLRLDLFQLPHALPAALSASSALLMLALLLPLVALCAALLLLLSSRARSVREAQLLFLPLLLLGSVPALAALLPGLELRSPLALVPVASTSVAVREVLAGRSDLPALALVFVVNSLAAALCVRAAWRSLDDEQRLLPSVAATAGPRDRSPLERQLPLIFGGMLAAILVFAINTSGAPALLTQVVFNLLGVFGGGTLLVLWRLRLDVDQTLSLRRPRAGVWLAVALGVPSVFIAGLGLAELLQHLLPVPQAWLESFTRALLPDEVPLHLLLLFVAFLPGVFEELAFRGLLLHGLRRRLRPALVVVVVGLVFGAFHLSLYRLLPTAVLGMVLTAVVLVSGSIFPAMLWHMAHNTVGVLAGSSELDFAELPGPLYGVAVAGCLLSAGVLWRAGPARSLADRVARSPAPRHPPPAPGPG